MAERAERIELTTVGALKAQLAGLPDAMPLKIDMAVARKTAVNGTFFVVDCVSGPVALLRLRDWLGARSRGTIDG